MQLTMLRPATSADQLTLQARPSFRDACELAAARRVAQFATLSPGCQWLLKDIGRTSICLLALILDASEHGLSARRLIRLAREIEMTSAGRVTLVLRRAEALGELTVAPGLALWTKRRLTPGRSLVDALRERARLEFEAAALLEPRAAAMASALEDDGAFKALLRALPRVLIARPRLMAPDPAADFFLQRDAGMLMLFDLMGRQLPDRERLLELAPLSRSALSRKFGVSRAHINKLFADAAGDGLVRFAGPDELEFSPELSAAVADHLADNFGVAIEAGEIMLEEVARRGAVQDGAEAAPSPVLYGVRG